jgi:hypothetical protein
MMDDGMSIYRAIRNAYRVLRENPNQIASIWKRARRCEDNNQKYVQATAYGVGTN